MISRISIVVFSDVKKYLDEEWPHEFATGHLPRVGEHLVSTGRRELKVVKISHSVGRFGSSQELLQTIVIQLGKK